ncbi:hypothetical protein ACFQE4_24685 [Streptomyces thermocoprophilus]|uniref:Integral membrane protein n=1 Tax=Streptomyces thermocoprophilus TaxID=78356 RepID=A0ABV5VKI3_9ACTN
MADRGLLRVARVAVFSLLCVLLAATGHSLAGGHQPPLALLVLGGTAVAVTAGRLAGRERTLGQISGAVTVAQGALHLLFAFAGSGHARGTPAAHEGRHAQPASDMGYMPHVGHHGSDVATGAAEAGSEPVGMALAAAHLSPLMLLAHVVAGLGAAWWLRQGEALVWRLCRLLGAPVSAVLQALVMLGRWSRYRAALSPLRIPLGFGADRESSCRTRNLKHVLARRGPPVPFTC